LKRYLKAKSISLKLCDPSSIIKSKYSNFFPFVSFFNILCIEISFLISNPKTLISLEKYLKFEIFISKQYIFDLGKYFLKAAADAPEYEPISKIFSFLFFFFLNIFHNI